MDNTSKIACDASRTSRDRLSRSPTSPARSNRVDNRKFLIKDNELIENIKSLEISDDAVRCSTVNRNTLSLDTSDERVESHQTFRKLTPVHHHPLMAMNDSFDDGDSLKNVNSTSDALPDVVPTFVHPRAPLDACKVSHRQETADYQSLMNNNNNNDVKQIRAAVKPFYREPSPVS